MAFRYQTHAKRRAAGAAVIGVLAVALLGLQLTIPALALVALVYYAHQLAAVLAGDVHVPYPSLAFVIVINSAVVLAVQVLLFVADLKAV